MLRVLRLVVRAGDIDDELEWRVLGRVLFGVDGAVAVQELVGDVSQNGSAARGDAAFRDEDEEFGEELVDLGGRLEFGEFPEEFGGEIVKIGLDGPRLGMPETETGLSVQYAKTALATVDSEMPTARVMEAA